MKKKHIIYTLSTIPLAITIGNVSDSDAFFRLDNFITRNRTVSDIVDIKDENLLKAINNQLGRGEVLDSVTIADMESLTILNAQERNISSIEGLEYAVNLTYLQLANNQISDISALSDLFKLNELYLDNNQISDINPIRNLTDLDILCLGFDGSKGNNIKDISPIGNLVNLKKLYLQNNKIENILILSNLINLTYLNLENNQISDISSLSNLTSLRELYLQSNQISDISAINNLTNLTYLQLANNQISDILALSSLLKLNELYLDNNQISDISSLSNLTNLNILCLGFDASKGNNIKDISPIGNLVNLKKLYLQNNKIENILILSNLINLTYLNLENNQISDISSLGNLTNLRELYLSRNQISDISALSDLINLNTLNIGANQISDISSISNLTKLTYLHFGTNKVVDIEPVGNLINLSFLGCDTNQISDISTLSNLTELTTIYMENNQISDISPIKNLKNLNTLVLSNQKPVIEVEDFKTEVDKLDISINNPIMGLNNKISNITNLSNSGIYENGKLKWNNVPLGSHTRTFNFSENIKIGSTTATFNGTATLNFNVVDGSAPESDHTSEFDSNDFGIYTTVTAIDLGEGVSHLIHKGIRHSLPYRFKYDVLEPINNVVEVYDLAGNKAEYQVKLKDNDTPAIEEGLDTLVNKDSIEKEDISYFRTIINDLDESMNKDLLQDRLNNIYPNTLSLDKKLTTSNLDVYIKSENILQMSLDTNQISFDDFSGVEDVVKENAVNLTINSSLPYQLNAYLPNEIQNADKTKTLDKSILNIKESSSNDYQTFANTSDKIVLKDNCSSGNYLTHGVDLKLAGGIAHEKDVYKATIKLEAEQK